MTIYARYKILGGLVGGLNVRKQVLYHDIYFFNKWNFFQ